MSAASNTMICRATFICSSSHGAFLRLPGARGTDAGGAGGRALLGARRPRERPAGDDRAATPVAAAPGAVARGARTPDRDAADRAEVRQGVTAGRESPAARVRAGDRRQLPHLWGVRRGASE